MAMAMNIAEHRIRTMNIAAKMLDLMHIKILRTNNEYCRTWNKNNE